MFSRDHGSWMVLLLSRAALFFHDIEFPPSLRPSPFPPSIPPSFHPSLLPSFPPSLLSFLPLLPSLLPSFPPSLPPSLLPSSPPLLLSFPPLLPSFPSLLPSLSPLLPCLFPSFLLEIREEVLVSESCGETCQQLQEGHVRRRYSWKCSVLSGALTSFENVRLSQEEKWYAILLGHESMVHKLSCQ